MASPSKASGPALVPPSNFAMVEEGIYRSAYPTEANVLYLRHIGITHVVLLSMEALPGPVKRALGAEVAGKAANGCITRGPIRVLGIADMRTWRVDGINCGDDFSRRDITRALDFAVDKQWHPVLFACPMGELQTSALVGCMRRYQHWSLASIFSECELFTNVCRNLRPSLLFLIESWDPASFPISAVNIHYRNHKMHLRDRTRACHERRRHRRAAATDATHAKARKSGTSESGEDSEEDGDYMEGAHSAVRDMMLGDGGTSSASPPAAAADATPRNGDVSSPTQKSFGEVSRTSSPSTPNTLPASPEAALISTSGHRPPMTMRRAAAQRAREQQHHQLQLKGPLHGRDEAALDTLVNLDDKGAGIAWAEWYLEAVRAGDELCSLCTNRLSLTSGNTSPDAPFGMLLPPPHVRYAATRNPPALDSRSKFTKESIVEEDDD